MQEIPLAAISIAGYMRQAQDERSGAHGAWDERTWKGWLR
jgi:hypothetical protein